jgi:hypothetical protein
MLGIVNQHGERRAPEAGADTGISNRQRRSRIPSPTSAEGFPSLFGRFNGTTAQSDFS